jgi:hypothetical protein
MRHEHRILDRLRPPDWEHVRKYPLTAAPAAPLGVPVVLGINWYTEFDNPVRGHDNRWWVARRVRMSATRWKFSGRAALFVSASKRPILTA